MSGSRAWLIDASIYIFRAYFSLPDRWHTTDGQSLNAVYGYASFLIDFLQRTSSPQYCAAAFDQSLGTCFRNDIYPQYKASRALPDEDLAFQLDTCRELTVLLGIPSLSGPRYEADDYIASLARLYREQGAAITVVTRDKDLGQLLSGSDDQWWDFAGNTLLDVDGFYQRFGVRPDQFADYLALVGDSIDDIPGVPGVGPKTAAALLGEHSTLAELKQSLHRIAQLPLRGAAKLGQKIGDHWDQVMIAKQLTALEAFIPGLDQAPIFVPDAKNAEAFTARLRELGLGGPLLQRGERMQFEWEAD